MNRLKNDWLLYLLLVPVLAWYLIFCYAPMGGLVLAFKDYSFKLGIWDSPWIGMGNFTKMFSDRYFLRGLKNTLVFGIGGILISMPCEIALALMLNELRLRGMKKFVQTTVTFPHFISWVVLAGILTNIFASTGAINQILRLFGMSAASPITSESGYRWFIWFSGIWKEVGWGSIIYLAAITSVEQDQYESASIDGASRLQQIWHITLPAIRSTICIMLILAVGSLLTNGRFDQIFNTYSSPVYPVADTIDTYIFRETFTTGIMNFGYSTAIGVLKSVVGLFMIVTTNKIVTSAGEQGLL
ncbi:MAG: ABC transporter permease subunit [Oscillospiraceae bacterium]|nr:sugar ABC transporter permease [Oscillospiraceae bacterium]MCI8941847.1 sugar ABC transporter permease [Oscillospiraceae bacterium]MDE7042421.1 ABC transporter permease subunit [Oscillospiraceae bacterium]